VLQKVRKHIIASIIIGAILYLSISIYIDFQSVIEAFTSFNIFLIPLLLLLSYLNYFTRFLKWHYYLRILKIGTKFWDSFLIFMSGLIMSVTPGKFGELLKSYMLKKINNEPISKTAPIVLVERITDFLSLLFIAIIGGYIFNIGLYLIIITTIAFLILVLILSNKTISNILFRNLARIKYLRKILPNIEEAYKSSFEMMKIKPLILMFFLSLLSWFFEFLGFYVVLNEYNPEITLFWSSFTYAFSTIIGSITLLPGGLGVTDGSLTFLLVNDGFSTNTAVASTFIIRVVTLWFAVFVGIISVIIYQRKFGRISNYD
jgi:uncharacterized protein (TIRG00374 family)